MFTHTAPAIFRARPVPVRITESGRGTKSGTSGSEIKANDDPIDPVNNSTLST